MTVKILLRERDSNTPIPHVKIRVYDEEKWFEAFTNTNGIAEFTTPPIPDGKYIIKIRAPDHQPYTEKTYISRNSYIMDIKLNRAYN